MEGRRRALTLLLCLVVPLVAWGGEPLTWLVRDLPPLTIESGPRVGQGAVDRVLPLLMQALPDHDHSVVRVNRARALQMLQEPALSCDPELLWTPDRSQAAVYSIPMFATLTNGLIIRHQDRHGFNSFMRHGALDLPALLASPNIKVGRVAERSYGGAIDTMLAAAPPAAINAHHGDDAVASLLQMQQRGRLDGVLGYWPEVLYLAPQQRIAGQDLEFLPVLGVPRYQNVYVACSNTAQGRAVIRRLNERLATLRITTLPGYYAEWLDPASRQDYLRDARRFFTDPATR
ncbi:TIGR02285 family protein [Pseudomonas sp.]|uniref:TIGR02285 family protein n=1 Tax=Pseudomonas sp. TaxID=306 RepID=UPI002586CEE7|nr:TIGR02285 family protein [Pseudomonas sp.]